MNVPWWRLVGVVLVLLAGTACSPPPSGSPSGSATALPSGMPNVSGRPTASIGPSVEGTATSVFDLEVTNCFDIDDLTGIDEVTVIDCAVPHKYEVFELADYEAGPGEEFPGVDALDQESEEVCRPGFEDYVGVPYEDSTWSATFITPSEETWAEGDREILCVVHNDGETALTGSAEGTNR